MGCNSRERFKEEFPEKSGSCCGTDIPDRRQSPENRASTASSVTSPRAIDTPSCHCTGRRYLRTLKLEGKDSIMMSPRPPGCSVFLVEDEVMIRMMVADMLEELGYSVAAEAGEIGEAVRLAQSTEFDLAILDVNVNGKVITPVAELIKARNRPFIFATGYGSSGLPEEYRDRPALQKPFQLETLAQMINTALKSAAA
jgi:CheY-like chemotaxis protein